MRLFFISIILLFITEKSIAQQCHRAAWVKTYGNQNIGEGILDVEQNPQGGFVVAGQFPMQGLTLGSETLPAGDGGYFLAQMDSSGTYTNLTEVLPLSYVTVKRITVLPDGSVAVACFMSGSFTLGNETFDAHGNSRALLVKFDAQFNYQWHMASHYGNSNIEARDVAHDSEGNIYWGGLFNSDYFVLNGQTIHKNNGRVWLAKHTSNGQLIWLNQIGSLSSTGMQTMAVDSEDNVWITGTATLSATSVFQFSQQYRVNGYLNNSYSFFAGKYSSDGDCIWGKLTSTAYTNNQSMYAWDAQCDELGNMYVCGKISGQHHLDGTLLYGDDGSGFLMKMQSNGDCEWFKTMNGQGSNEEAARLHYRDGKIAVMGYLSSNQPYIGDFPAHSTISGTSKHFNANFLADGNLEFARVYDSSSGNHYLSDVVLDEGGNQLLFGQFKGAQLWYPVSLNQSGSNVKLYIAKFNAASFTPFSISAGPDKTTTCNTSVQLSGSTLPPSGVDIGWYPSVGFSGNNSKTPNVIISTPQSFIFYGYYQGCVVIDTVQVILSDYDLTLQVPEEEMICVGETLLVDAVSNHPDATFAWLPNYRMTTATAASTGIYTNVDINYVVEATYNNCKAKDTIHVIAKPLPFIYTPYNQYYLGNYQIHTCLNTTVDVDLGVAENTYTMNTGIDAIWNSTHDVTLIANEYIQAGIITAASPFGCVSTLPVLLYGHDSLPPPPIVEHPTDTIYLCPASGLVYEESIAITSDYVWDDEFQYSWYPGWQVDSLDGLGWRDIPDWEWGHYRENALSWGDGNSIYYSELEFWNVHAEMDGFKFRSYVSDICSERAYTNEMVLRVGPAIESQTQEVSICEGASDSIFVLSTLNTSSYQWEVFTNGIWEVIVNGTNHEIESNVLHLLNVYAGMDSLYRCRTTGCDPQLFMYSEEIVLSVIPMEMIEVTPLADEVCPGGTASILLPVDTSGYNFQWYVDDEPLADSPTIEGTASNELLIHGVDNDLAQLEFKCYISAAQCGLGAFTDSIFIVILPTYTATLELETNIVCINSGMLALSGGNPSGGYYSGEFSDNDLFDATAATAGQYVIAYNVAHPVSACVSSASDTLHVMPLPVVNFILENDLVCNNEAVVYLQSATPAGGSYSGINVMEEDLGTFQFVTQMASQGVYEITYTYADDFGCTATATDSMHVHAPQSIVWVENLGTFCIGAADNLVEMPQPAGGSYTNDAIVDSQLQTELYEAGQHEITYTYTTEQGCVSEATAAFDLQGVNATLQFTDTMLCENGIEVTLYGGEPAGGVYEIDGIESVQFDPALWLIGEHMLTYAYTDALSQCSDEESLTIYLNATPQITWTDEWDVLCTGLDSVFINTAIPQGGTFSDAVVNNGYLMLDGMSAGDYAVGYHYTDANGCTDSQYIEFTLAETPQVNWTSETNFEICVNLEFEVDFGQFVNMPDGTFSCSVLEFDGSIWENDFTLGEQTIMVNYEYTDAISGCTTVVSHEFYLILCFGVEELMAEPTVFADDENVLHVQNASASLQVQLFDASGQIVLSELTTGANYIKQLQLASGVYTVHLHNGSHSWNRKIVLR
ncbi:MAG: T9SS type A sorting domain-containing protein [Flavobacteriales bacterium]